MSHALLRIALSICVATALAACGGGGGGTSGLPVATTPASTSTATPAALPATPAAVSATLDAAGGTFIGPGGVTVTVPAGALSKATTLTITETSTGAPAQLPQGGSGALAQSKTYELTPHDVQFAQPVTIRIPVDTSKGMPVVYVSELTMGWYPQESTNGNGYVEIQRTGFSWLSVLTYSSVSTSGRTFLLGVSALDITSPRSMKIPNAARDRYAVLKDLFSPAAVQVEALQSQEANALFVVKALSDRTMNGCQASQLALDMLVGNTWLPLDKFVAASKTREQTSITDVFIDTSNFNVKFTPLLLGTFDLRVRAVCDNAADLKAIDPRLADFTWKLRMKVGPSYTVGGTVGGLPGGGSVKLALNGGAAQTVTANGGFTAATRLGNGDSYAITTSDAPAGYGCTLANASGTMGNANVSNVAVTCSPTPYSLSGTITGLPNRASVTLLLNGANGQTVSNPSGNEGDLLPFTLATLVVPGQAYEVTAVSVSASGYACSVSSGSGTMPANAVDGIFVNCTPAGPFSLGGSASGLDAGAPYPSMVLMRDGNAMNTTTVPLTGSGAYSFGTVPGGTGYFVSVDTTGTGYSCFAVNRNGAATANVGNIDVSCTASGPAAPGGPAPADPAPAMPAAPTQ